MVGACLLALLAGGCGGSRLTTTGSPGTAPASAVRPVTVTLGFLGPLSGSDAGLGTQIDNGAKLAVTEYNATGGSDLAGGGYEVARSSTSYGPGPPTSAPVVKFVTFDSRGNPARASSLAQRAIDQRVVALVGPVLGAESAAADPVLEQAGIVNVTASATQPALASNGWKYWHRIVAGDGAQAAATSAFLHNTIQARAVAVVDDSSPAGRSLAQAVAGDLRSAGGSVVLTTSVDSQGLTDPGVAGDIEAAGADAVYFAGTAREAVALETQLRTIGVQAVFVAGGQADSSGLVQQDNPQITNGTFVVCPCIDPQATPQGEAFSLAYQAAFGSPPGPYAVEGFDAANVILAAIGAGNKTSLAINSYLAGHSFKGISKTITFDGQGQVASDGVWLSQVQNGALVFLQPLS